MRAAFFCSLIFALLITTNREPQAAPWCSEGSNGSSNCGFYSYQQCREYLAGIGGQCERNLWDRAVAHGPSYRSDPYQGPLIRQARRYPRQPDRYNAGQWQTTRHADGWLIQRHDRSGAWRAIPSDPGRRVAYRWNGGAWVPTSYTADQT